MEFAQHFDSRINQQLAGTSGAPGADDFVVSLVISPAVRDIADGTVGKFSNERVLKRRGLLDRKSQLHEYLSRQAHPGSIFPKRYDLHFHLMRSAVSFGDVEYLESPDDFKKLGRILCSIPR